MKRKKNKMRWIKKFKRRKSLFRTWMKAFNSPNILQSTHTQLITLNFCKIHLITKQLKFQAILLLNLNFQEFKVWMKLAVMH